MNWLQRHQQIGVPLAVALILAGCGIAIAVDRPDDRTPNPTYSPGYQPEQAPRRTIVTVTVTVTQK